METVIIVSTRNALACWMRLYGMPDYDEMKNAMTEYNAPYYELFFADWPEEEIFPPSFDKFAQWLHKTYWLIQIAEFGSCDV